jgi:hypothetical protein
MVKSKLKKIKQFDDWMKNKIKNIYYNDKEAMNKASIRLLEPNSNKKEWLW